MNNLNATMFAEFDEAISIVKNARKEVATTTPMWDTLFHAQTYIEKQYKEAFNGYFTEETLSAEILEEVGK